MDDKLFNLILLAPVFCVFLLLLRQYVPQYAPLLNVAAVLAVFACALPAVTELIGSAMDISVLGALPNSDLIAKAAAVTVIGRTAELICSDSGQAALAYSVSVVARVSLVLVCIPLIKEILSVVSGLLA